MPTRKGFASIILIVVVLAAVGAAAYFAFFKKAISLPSTGPYDKVFRLKPQPVAVTPVKTETSKSALIPEDGGTLALKDQQEMILNVPKGALLSSEEIKLQALKTLEQLPEGYRFIAGAELTPDGLGFVKNSTLSIKLPSGTPTGNLVAFAYEEGGQNFYLQPYSIEEDIVEIPLSGFSGGGIIDIPALIPIINPGTPEQTAKQLLADVLKRAGGKMLSEIKKGKEGSVDPKLQDEARGILNAWYENGVKPDLKAAEKDDSKVDGAIRHTLVWREQVHVFGLDQYFQKEFEQSLNSAAKAVKHGVYQSDKRCLNQKDPRQVSSLLRWLKLTQQVGLAGRAGLVEEEIQKKAKNCVVFEIHMDSTINAPSISIYTNTKLNAILELSDDFLRLTGSGVVEEGPAGWSGGCRQNPITYNFTIPDTQFNINFNKSAKVDMLIDIPAGGDVPLSCGGGTTVSIPAIWSTDYFPGFHEDELVSGSSSTYFLQNWQIVGSKEIYAQKVYNRSIEGGIENTKFILKHTPRE